MSRSFFYHLILFLASCSLANPVPAPDHPWSAGFCQAPEIKVDGIGQKFRTGPKVVSGLRTRANPNGGESFISVECSFRLRNWFTLLSVGQHSLGSASFSNSWSISLSKSITVGLGLDRYDVSPFSQTAASHLRRVGVYNAMDFFQLHGEKNIPS